MGQPTGEAWLWYRNPVVFVSLAAIWYDGYTMGDWINAAYACTIWSTPAKEPTKTTSKLASALLLVCAKTPQKATKLLRKRIDSLMMILSSHLLVNMELATQIFMPTHYGKCITKIIQSLTNLIIGETQP